MLALRDIQGNRTWNFLGSLRRLRFFGQVFKRIRDRVVQMAVVLVIGPIFEADLLPEQYGFRPGLGAKMALRRV
jgi:hypothetical protein